MKKIVSLLLALIMISSFCAFSQQAEAAAAEEPAPEADALVVDTCILLEADDAMINNYSLLAVNPEAPWVDADGNAVSDVTINTVGAAALINWLLSEEGQELAANYGFEEYGEYLFYLKDGRPVSEAEIPAATEETKIIRPSTTTSVNDSGLLGYLLPVFEEKYGYEVEVYSAGTGKSIANAKMGNADLILVHSKKQEEAFIADGFSYVIDGMENERLNWMYNYFVLCGPSGALCRPAGPAVLRTGGEIANPSPSHTFDRGKTESRRFAPCGQAMPFTSPSRRSSVISCTPTARTRRTISSPWPTS